MSVNQCVVVLEVGHCLDGDTLIDCPRDLESHPLGIPIRELVGQTPWVFAWKDGRIVIRKAARVWLSMRNVETVRVTLRQGPGRRRKTYQTPLELVGTPDLPVLLRDGLTWKNLGDLTPRDRLSSLYRSSNGPRSRITWTGFGERIREHVFVAEEVYGPRPDGCDCHHRDGRMLNQHPENLEWKDEFQHLSDHARGKTLSEEHRARLIEASTGRRPSLETRRKQSKAHTGKKLSAEAKAKMSAATKGRTQSPELIEKRREGIRRYYANGGRSGMFGKTTSEETRRKQSEAWEVRKSRSHEEGSADNHSVVSVEAAEPRDAFEMFVPNTNGFVANGIVVHNSLDGPIEP